MIECSILNRLRGTGDVLRVGGGGLPLPLLQHGDGGMGNNSMTLAQGLWSFLVKVDPTKTSGEVGTVIVQECSAK